MALPLEDRFTPRSKKVLARADVVAKADVCHVCTWHILVALAESDDAPTASFLADHGITVETILKHFSINPPLP